MHNKMLFVLKIFLLLSTGKPVSLEMPSITSNNLLGAEFYNGILFVVVELKIRR
jgi:hypothetical protein